VPRFALVGDYRKLRYLGQIASSGALQGDCQFSKAFLFDAVTYQNTGYFDPFPLLLRLGRVLQMDSIKLLRLRRILSMLSADRQRIRPTRKQIAGR
jgi:hypothetical protein